VSRLLRAIAAPRSWCCCTFLITCAWLQIARERLAEVMRYGLILPDRICEAHAAGCPKSRWFIETHEFQGRGLPHAHRLDYYGGTMTIADIDNVVMARHPTASEETYFQSLYNVSLKALVKKHMIHKHTLIVCKWREKLTHAGEDHVHNYITRLVSIFAFYDNKCP
jgi:hypothetical protein